MAIFNDVRDIERTSGRTKPFEKTTGWRKNALAVLGYNDDGTKNTFGKYFGHGNVLLDHYVPKAIAQGDSKEVIGANESSSWGEQIGSFKVASNFIGGGALSGIGKGKAAASGGSTGIGSGIDADAISGGVAQSANRQEIQSIYSEQSNDNAKKLLDENVSNSQNPLLDENSYTTEEDSRILEMGDEDSLLDEDEYSVLNEESNGNKKSKAISEMFKATPLLGDIAETYQFKLQAGEDSRKKRKEIARRSLIKPSKQNYL